jgi:hypothetical protein
MARDNLFCCIVFLERKNLPNGIPSTTSGENVKDFGAFENTDKKCFSLKI